MHRGEAWALTYLPLELPMRAASSPPAKLRPVVPPGRGSWGSASGIDITVLALSTGLFFQTIENCLLSPLSRALLLHVPGPRADTRAQSSPRPPHPCLTTHCAAWGGPAPSSLGGTEPHDHRHPGPPLLVFVDARPPGPQTVRGHPKDRRSPRGHGESASPPGLETQVRPPRCRATLSGAGPAQGVASGRGCGEGQGLSRRGPARGGPTESWERPPTAGGWQRQGRRVGAGGAGSVWTRWLKVTSRKGQEATLWIQRHPRALRPGPGWLRKINTSLRSHDSPACSPLPEHPLPSFHGRLYPRPSSRPWVCAQTSCRPPCPRF